ncbi:hypothetical protein VE01_05699 [Pseudogymnoascus verrucosus]|uniref:Uncharacterized protein n=1 Tax=Pseudogymnoascus verrucosus TaxID=342668 RepID=A0A1B8GKS0_9PEZI|nr:uncharacterized protein VE01_05699 [Pseudogymnoascus verrucosus]OBT96435.1 hypothetical protein VE01_05699 [Pseudogymnoascus verrucosus]
MNAHALLTSQGWRGSGHSLHAHSDSIGLARPLLVSQKQNTLGVGKKQHRTSDMWWMNAFDKSLQGLDTSKEGQVVQTVTGGGLDMVKRGGGKYVGTGGLYACFVRGETLVGSVKEVVEVEAMGEETVDKKAEKKRRKEGETKEERRERKLEKRAKRAAKSSAKSSANESSNTPSDESDSVETKAQRKERRRLKKASKAEAAASQDSSDTPSSKDDKKKKKRKD